MAFIDVSQNVTPVSHTNSGTFIHPSQRVSYDKDVSFEEYLYYAQLTRSRERLNSKTLHNEKTGILHQVSHIHRNRDVKGSPTDSKTTTEVSLDRSDSGSTSKKHRRRSSSGRFVVTNEEWVNAARAMRTASWGAAFYLITTDVLGPFGVGFSLGTLGWSAGIALYTVFAFMAGYSGYLLWKLFLGLDSYEFPIRNYGDLVFRTMGSIPRYCVNILQSVQLILVVGQVIIQNGQGLSQLSKFQLCYVVCIVLFVLAGFAVGQVRTLRNFGVLSMIAVGLNLLIIFISMGVMAHSPPNYAISVLGSSGSAVDPNTVTPDSQGNYPPIRHYTGLPSSATNSLIGSINGLMSGVYAYGGAQIFPEIMAEMRRPTDFLKSMCIAQFFIWSVYLVYGCYVYYFQGQYAFAISYLGLSVYKFQAACDMMAVLAGVIMAGLYGNIGIKVLYNNVLMELCRAPPINTRKGRFVFSALVPIYWSVAFVVAAAIPNYFGFVSVIASFCVVQFSYTFPPVLFLAYSVRINARLDGEGFDARTGLTRRVDGGVKRVVRGFWRHKWYLNVWHVVHALGALVTAGLGAYAAIWGMVLAFRNPQVNSFTCRSPLDLTG